MKSKASKASKPGRKTRYPYPFIVPSRSLVVSWGLKDRLRWARRRARDNYMKPYKRRGIPIPPMSDKWDPPIPDPPSPVGPRPFGMPAWYRLKEDPEYDFEYCAVSPRSQMEFDEEMLRLW